LRYHGQGLSLTVDTSIDELKKKGFDAIGAKFDELHERLFTFASHAEKELVNLRAVVLGPATKVTAKQIAGGGDDAAAAIVGDHEIFYDGKSHKTKLYDRSKIKARNKIEGPAIVMEMDSTTLILPGHVGEVDSYGNIVIRPQRKG